ncbi:MAG: glycosyltransferase family 39 protein [Acidobacteria bacterium]|nr:glycosyltransferase family 39 protein [Acidobacteriota bacterium]
MSGKTKFILILIFLVGAAVRLPDVRRPIDRASWRECDLGAVARNYATESMNPLRPRIDWRGTTPGDAEMEFPLYPYLTAIAYKIFGVHDYFGRVWSFLFALGTLLFFFRLAREYLTDAALVFACAFFAFNPLIIEFSTAIQPEGLMLLFYTAAVFYFLKWLENENPRDFAAAAALTALTLLAKATAAHIGLFFGVLLVQKYGRRVFRETRVWIFGAAALVPALGWYVYAKSLWKTYGNSLGVSNEYHWIGADFFTNSYFVKGILFAEFSVVWVFFGLALGVLALVRGFREKVVRHALLWTAAIFVMYLAAARTTADEWANYYHIFAIAPAALLFGAGVGRLAEVFASLFNFGTDFPFSDKLRKTLLVVAGGFAVLAVFAFDARAIRARLLEERVPDQSFACAAKIKPALAADGLILVSGGHCRDADGYAVAYNASFMFYWLERKGFNVCAEEQSIQKVREFAAKGARYFVAQKSMLALKPNFAAELRQNFQVVAECDDFLVFEIKS